MAINIKALREKRAAKALEARNLLDAEHRRRLHQGRSKAQIDTIYEEIDLIDSSDRDAAERQARIDGDALEQDGARAEQRDRDHADMSPEQRERADPAIRPRSATICSTASSGMTREDMSIFSARGASRTRSPASRRTARRAAISCRRAGVASCSRHSPSSEACATSRTSGRPRAAIPIPWPTVDETGVDGRASCPRTPRRAPQDFTFGTTSDRRLQVQLEDRDDPLRAAPGSGRRSRHRGLHAPGAGEPHRADHQSAQVHDRQRASGEPQGVGDRGGGRRGRALPAPPPPSALPDSLHRPRAFDRPGVPQARPVSGTCSTTARCASAKKLKDGQGNYLWKPGFNIKEPDTINGYAYTINQQMPAMAANAKSILFGDFSAVHDPRRDAGDAVPLRRQRLHHQGSDRLPGLVAPRWPPRCPPVSRSRPTRTAPTDPASAGLRASADVALRSARISASARIIQREEFRPWRCQPDKKPSKQKLIPQTGDHDAQPPSRQTPSRATATRSNRA